MILEFLVTVGFIVGFVYSLIYFMSSPKDRKKIMGKKKDRFKQEKDILKIISLIIIFIIICFWLGILH